MFWIGCHIKSHIPHLLRCWKEHKPNLGYLRVWGCLAYVRLSDSKIPKLGIKASTYAFLGYAINSAAYRFFDLENKIILNLVMQFFKKKNFLLNWKIVGVKKIFFHNLVLLLHIYKIKKILKWNLEGVKELELKMILIMIIMFLTLRKIPKI